MSVPGEKVAGGHSHSQLPPRAPWTNFLAGQQAVHSSLRAPKQEMQLMSHFTQMSPYRVKPGWHWETHEPPCRVKPGWQDTQKLRDYCLHVLQDSWHGSQLPLKSGALFAPHAEEHSLLS